MTKASRLARAGAAAAALVVAGSAFAQSQSTITPEVGVTYLAGKTVERNSFDTGGGESLGLNAAIGWEHESGFGVRALFLFDLQPVRGIFQDATNIRSFDQFIGVEATGSVALGPKFKLRVGAGVGRTRLDVSPDISRSDVTDGVLSLGLQWQPSRHYAMELRVEHLTSSNVTSSGIQFQWPF